ncbi:DUF2071 domain-containing protein [Bacillus daqingensis]|uniref:DUF2071 domain-containing protein n=1 Tax=Bacillus daqingensis TaxID=872396 RepID=A0ABV9NWG0_9BACI
MPTKPTATQTWENMLLYHLEVDPDRLAEALPEPFQPSLFDGKAWLTTACFTCRSSSAVFLGRSLSLPVYEEVQVRTYLDYDGDPGLYMFSSDVSHRSVVKGARLTLKLPFYEASIERRRDTAYHVMSKRLKSDARFQAAFRPGTQRDTTTFADWAGNRSCMWKKTKNGVEKAVINPGGWDLYEAEAEVSSSGMYPFLAEDAFTGRSRVQFCPERVTHFYPFQRTR